MAPGERLQHILFKESEKDFANIPQRRAKPPLSKYHARKTPTFALTEDIDDDDDDDVDKSRQAHEPGSDTSDAGVDDEERKARILARLSNKSYRARAGRYLDQLLVKYPNHVNLNRGTIQLKDGVELLVDVLYDLAAYGIAKHQRTRSPQLLQRLVGDLHIARKPVSRKLTTSAGRRKSFFV